MRAVIIANGNPPDPTFAREKCAGADLIICADGGSLAALAAGLRPDRVIGDMDSTDGDTMRALIDLGAKVIRYPARKNETDLELAILHAVESGAGDITILGAIGDRMDQTLANMMLLTLPQLDGVPARILDEGHEIQLIRDRGTIEGEVGDVVSLLALGGDSVGVESEGLEYPLAGSTLVFGPARGVSNVLTAPVANVSVASGMLLAIRLVNRND